MPKREATPEPADDEPNYFTVVYPYPAHANVELVEDQKSFTFWISCIVGQQNLYSFYHKPRSPNMIIIEVNKLMDAELERKLLGAHKWSEVLRNPGADEKDRVSKIYFCEYKSHREVQKHGWKQISVEESWFREARWKPDNKIVTFPYPLSAGCDLPFEDPTARSLCRFLPKKYFPQEIPKERPPPVGTIAWQQQKDSIPPPRPKKSGGTAGELHSPPKLSIPSNRNGGTNITMTSAPTSAAATSPSVNTGAKSWAKIAALKSSPQIVTSGPTLPPGLCAPSAPPVPGSSSTPSPSSDDTTPPALSHSGASSSGSQPSDDENNEWLHVVESGAHKAPERGPVPADKFESAMANLHITGDEELDEWGIPAAGVAATPDVDQLWGAPAAEHVEVYDNLWEDYDKPKEEKKPEGIMCKEHGRICKRGICKVYAGQLREIEREKARKERAEKDKEWRDAKARGKPKRKGKDSASDSTSPYAAAAPPPRPRPPHLMRGNKSAPPATAAKPAAAPTIPKAPNSDSTVRGDDPSDSDSDDPWSMASNGPWGGGAERWAAKAKDNVKVSADAVADADETRSVVAPSESGSAAGSGWGSVSNGPWGAGPANTSANHGQSQEDDARSVAGSAWGNVSEGPWRKPRPVEGKRGGFSRDWADDYDDQVDDARSIAESSASGWGNVSNGPWSK